MLPPGYPWVSLKNVSQFGPASTWPAIANYIYTHTPIHIFIYKMRAFLYTSWTSPALPVEKKIRTFSAFDTPGHPWVSTKKIQPIRSSRLAGYTQHIYIRMSGFIIKILRDIKLFLESSFFICNICMWCNVSTVGRGGSIQNLW